MSTDAKTPAVNNDELGNHIKEAALAKSTAAELRDAFGPLLDQAKDWKEKAEALVVTDESQTDLMQQAREARLALRAIRIEADKRRKDLKADALRYGNAVQGAFNILRFLVEPIEEHLHKQEKFAELERQRKWRELTEKRQEETADLAAYIPQNIALGALSVEDYERLVKGARLQKQQEEEAEIQRAKDAAEREERNRVNRDRARESLGLTSFIPGYDLDRLFEYSDDDWAKVLEAANGEKEKADAERARIEKEKAEAEARLQAEREEREAAERKAEEAREKDRRKAERERKAAERKLQEEREKREELERKQREEREAAARAEMEEKRRKADEERKRAQAPDKEKLDRLAAEIAEIRASLPKMTTESGQSVANNVDSLLAKVVGYITEKTAKL